MTEQAERSIPHVVTTLSYRQVASAHARVNARSELASVIVENRANGWG